MDEVSVIPPLGDVVKTNNNSDSMSDVIDTIVGTVVNSDSLDWWPNNLDDSSPLPLDASEGGLWTGNFVPPPPRPAFLDDAVTPDGVTTCDLCSWAWKDTSSLFSLDGTLKAPGELGWLLTLIIVSLISAVIGAVIMVAVLHWRRFKTSGTRGLCSLCAKSSTNIPTPNNHVSVDNEQNIRMRERAPTPNSDSDKDPNAGTNNSNINGSVTVPTGVWSWLTSKKSSTNSIQLIAPSNTVPAENHYTHMDEAYAAVGEALYAELDRESNCSPAYQNTAYTNSDTEPDAPVSSAPSSAYYSDLSVATVPERAYEIVGTTPSGTTTTTTATIPTTPTTTNNNNWENTNGSSNEFITRRVGNSVPTIRLSAINETVTVQPSDYV